MTKITLWYRFKKGEWEYAYMEKGTVKYINEV